MTVFKQVARANCQALFTQLLKAYEPERLLLGELGFLRLVTGIPDLTAGYEPAQINLQFNLNGVYYICTSHDGRLSHTSPRMYLSIPDAMQRWEEMIQERI